VLQYLHSYRLLHLFLGVSNPTLKDCECCFGFWQAGRVINLANSSIRTAFLKLQPECDNQSAISFTAELEGHMNTDRVVEACAKMFPPIGFFSLDAYGPAAASGLDITWLL
jgi:hypothetical protein